MEAINTAKQRRSFCTVWGEIPNKFVDDEKFVKLFKIECWIFKAQ